MTGLEGGGRMVEADGYEAGYSAGLQEGLRRSIRGTLNEKKIKDVLDYCYEQAHTSLAAYHRENLDDDVLIFLLADNLEQIEAKIETLDGDDLGEEDV